MGYVKKWIPPAIARRNDLAAWKAVFGDLHQNLLDAGLVQTATAGQLVIDSVASLPADGAYAGFVEYAFSDALQATAPVVIKLEYGCGVEGLNTPNSGGRSRALRVRATVSFKGRSADIFGCPQGLDFTGGYNSADNTTYGISSVCANNARGFFGIVYGAGSRNKPFAHTSMGTYYGATLTLFLQRTVDAGGMPAGDGLMLYYPGLNVSASYGWTDTVFAALPSACSQFVGGSTIAASRDHALRIGMNREATIGGEVQTQQIFCPTPKPVAFPWIVSYAAEHGAHSIPEGTEFNLEVFPGVPSNFIALGNETGIIVDGLVGPRAGIAMLFE